MTYFKIPAIDLKGRDATTKFWRDSFRDAEVIGLDYTITDCFQAGHVFMVDLQLLMEVAGSSWDVNHEQIQLDAKQIMSLTIHDNKITHQTDYVDYHSVNN